MFKSPSARRAITAGLGLALAGSLTLVAVPSNALTLSGGLATDTGLFGSGDPTYTGVYRQSLALMALEATGATPPAVSVSWLLSQQCTDGGFQGYTTSPTSCAAPDSTNYAGEDSNNTALALQALSALAPTATGQSATDVRTAAQKAADWLVSHQGTDRGFAYYPDQASAAASDANSTAVSLIALNAFNAYAATVPVTNPPTVTAYPAAATAASGFLSSLQLVPCPVAPAEWPVNTTDGSFTYTATGQGASSNNYATVQASFALSGHLLTDGPFPDGTVIPVGVTCTGSTPDPFDPAKVSADYINSWVGGTATPFAGENDEAGWAALSMVASGLALPLVGDQPSLSIALTAEHATVANGSTDPGLLAMDILTRHAQPIPNTPTDPEHDAIPGLTDRLLATLAPVVTVAPKVTGAVKVGQKVTCDPGTWIKSPTSYTAAWYAGTSLVSNSAALTIPATQVGTSLRCTVKVTNTFGTSTASSTSVKIAPGTLTNTALPTIVGTARVGRTLAAISGMWKPSALKATYVWKRGNTVVGRGIAYVVKKADKGKQLVVVVTVTRPGYLGTATSKPRTVR